MREYRIVEDFDYQPESGGEPRRATHGTKLTSEDVSDERAAEMVTLGVLEEVKAL